MLKILNNKVCNKSISLISNDFSNLQKQGLALIKVLELLEELELNKRYKDSLVSIKDYIKGGYSLEEAFSLHKNLYPDLFITFISLGEKYGKVPEVMESISTYYSQCDYVKRKVKEALSYPMLLVICMVMLMVFLIFFMVPNLVESINIDSDTLSFSMSIMIYINDKVRENPLVSLVTIISWFIVVPIIIIKPKWKKIIECFKNKLKLTRMTNELTIISILSTIYKSGISLNLGLSLAIESMNDESVKATLESMYKMILKGDKIVEAAESTGKLSAYTISMIMIGEEGGTLEEKLSMLEKVMKEKIEAHIKVIVSIIQPTMIFTMTGIIVLFLLTCVLPIFSTMLDGVG